MNIGKKKRLAATVLKCGENRIWFDPKRLAEIKEAITKVDIRGLIKNLAIQKKPYTSHSHTRLRENKLQRKKGRRQGPGSRKGKQSTRISSKRVWINRIRAQRQVLKELNRRGVIPHALYHTLYKKAKGGFFRSRRHIHLYLEEHGVAKTEHETKTL
ncbi:MAG: 50S ribosomal protein L19e [Nanoarchaeota archaeon]